MNLWQKMHKAEKRVKIKRELRKRSIPFEIDESTKSLNLKLKEIDREYKEDRCKEINILEVNENG